MVQTMKKTTTIAVMASHDVDKRIASRHSQIVHFKLTFIISERKLRIYNKLFDEKFYCNLLFERIYGFNIKMYHLEIKSLKFI